MIAPWIEEEMQTTDLNDERLNERLNLILSAFAEQPTASIPAACGGYAEMVAAYRFFDNEKVTFDLVLSPHIESTCRRMAEQSMVLLVQDTSEVDLTRPQSQVAGAGPLDGGSRRGALLHELHAFTPDGTPLGTVWAEAWVRDEDNSNKSAAEKREERRAAPIEDKESFRWLETLREAHAVAAQMPHVQCICVADSEADIYEVLAEPTGPQAADWIVRACQDRALVPGETTVGCVREQVLKQPVLFTQTITVRERQAKVSCEERGRRQPRAGRQAVMEVRAGQVTLRPPYRSDRRLPAVALNVVLVREVDPPAGEEPVEWVLLTTLPIDTVEQVRQVIQYYCTRWMIEVFFKTLKSGCRVEERLFEHIDRLLPCLAVYLIVSWRTLYLCRLGRSCPEMSCEAVFEPCEWKSVYRLVTNQQPPATPPRLADMIRLIAQLGGYVNRKRPDPPGPQTVWLGLQRMHDMAWAWQIFGPGAKSEEALV
jgi:hypothetical protein